MKKTDSGAQAAPQLWRHLLLDQVLHLPLLGVFILVMYFLSVYGGILTVLLLNESGVIGQVLTPAVKLSHAIGLAIGLVGSAGCGRLGGKFYLGLPVSRASYGRYLWLVQVILPTLVHAPLSLVALWRYNQAPFGATLTFVLLAVLPLAAAACLLAELKMARAQIPSQLFYLLPVFGAILIAVLFLAIHYFLTVFAGFPWLFIVLIPASLAAVYLSRKPRITSQALLPPKPWGFCLLDLPLARRLACFETTLVRAALMRMLVLTASICAWWLYVYKVSHDEAATSRLIAVVIPAVFFYDAAAYVADRLAILRIVPVTASRMAGLVMAYGLVGTLFSSLCVIATARAAAQNTAGPFPLNMLLLCATCSMFAPLLLVAIGKVLLTALAATCLIVALFIFRLSLPAEPDLMLIPAAAAYTLLNFIWLRNALARMTPAKSLMLATRWTGVTTDALTNRL